MPLDPIVSLSVAVAEAPGSQAFLLGSGISLDSGIPTGRQVFWLAVGELYRLETETSETPDEEALEAWLRESDRAELTYSEVLELIAPTPANRRDYLAKHFAGKTPGPAHEELAALAVEGAVRVFVTTNFDRLLEHALQARGIEPVIVTDAASLASVPRREHADCYVLKPHGDYLQETIRNTPSELAEFEPQIATELGEIFDRFGIVVVGYSGSDAGLAELLERRRSRYGVYWLTRSDPGDGAKRIIEATGARVIKREGAAEFLADLRRRLEVFRSYPSGHSPVEVHDEVLALIRAKDDIGLAEVMRRERRALADEMTEIVAEGRQGEITDERMLAAHDRVLPVWERRLAGLLPVIAYAPDRFPREIQSLIDLHQNRARIDGPTAWPQLIDWTTWWLGYSTGAFALFLESWMALEDILGAEFAPGRRHRRRLVAPVRENVGHNLGRLVMARLTSTTWSQPRWEHLAWSLSQCAVIKERWPEFLRNGSTRQVIDNFDFLVTLRFALNGEQVLAYWGAGSQGGEGIARRLRGDDAYRAEVAAALDLRSESLVERAINSVSSMSFPFGFLESNAIDVLKGEE